MRRPFAALLSVLSLIAGLTALAPPAANADTALAFGAAADSVVNASVSDTNSSRVLNRLDARAASERHIYMRFTVTGVPAGDDIESTSLRLVNTDASTGTVTVNSTANAWAENTITWNNKPASGALRATKTLAPGSAVATDFDVTSAVTGNGDASFLLTTTLQNVLTIGARENSNAALHPQLIIKTKTAAQPIAWGSSVEIRNGETRREALLRTEATMGKGALRYYHAPGQGPNWPTSVDPLENRSLVYSFRYDPAQVLAGNADAQFRRFLTAAVNHLSDPPNPTARVYWCFDHEPEDDIARGAFTAKQFRDAFTRFINISHESAFNNPRLQSTLILMKYTLQANSHRAFADYFPRAVDMLGFDTYMWETNTSIPSMIDPVVAIAQQYGKPWAIAETGITAELASGPRQAALHDLAAYLATRTPAPEYVTYFNSDPGGPSRWNWPIDDEPTMADAWRSGQDGA